MLGVRSLSSYVLQTFLLPGRQARARRSSMAVMPQGANPGHACRPSGSRGTPLHAGPVSPYPVPPGPVLDTPRSPFQHGHGRCIRAGLLDDTLRFTSPDCIHFRGRAFIASRHPIHMSLRGRLRLLASPRTPAYFASVRSVELYSPIPGHSRIDQHTDASSGFSRSSPLRPRLLAKCCVSRVRFHDCQALRALAGL